MAFVVLSMLEELQGPLRVLCNLGEVAVTWGKWRVKF